MCHVPNFFLHDWECASLHVADEAGPGARCPGLHCGCQSYARQLWLHADVVMDFIPGVLVLNKRWGPLPCDWAYVVEPYCMKLYSSLLGACRGSQPKNHAFLLPSLGISSHTLQSPYIHKLQFMNILNKQARIP